MTLSPTQSLSAPLVILSRGHNAHPLPKREEQLSKDSPLKNSVQKRPGGGRRCHLLLGLRSDSAEGIDEPEVLLGRQLRGKQAGVASVPHQTPREELSRQPCPAHCRCPSPLTSAAPTLASSSRKISMKWLFTPLGAWLSGCRISVVSSSNNCSICLKKEMGKYSSSHEAPGTGVL